MDLPGHPRAGGENPSFPEGPFTVSDVASYAHDWNRAEHMRIAFGIGYLWTVVHMQAVSLISR